VVVDNKSVMIILNNSTKTQTLKTNRFKESIENYTAGKEVLSGNTIDLKNEITIEAKSSLIIELQ
jgi:hypothetical protein